MSKKIGFLRFLQKIDTGLWDVDTRKEGSPFESAVFRAGDIVNGVPLDKLPSRDIVFEFTLKKNPNREPQLQAVDLNLVMG